MFLVPSDEPSVSPDTGPLSHRVLRGGFYSSPEEKLNTGFMPQNPTHWLNILGHTLLAEA